MRLRRDNRAPEYLAQDEKVISKPEDYKGKWMNASRIIIQFM